MLTPLMGLDSGNLHALPPEKPGLKQRALWPPGTYRQGIPDDHTSRLCDPRGGSSAASGPRETEGCFPGQCRPLAPEEGA